jgi:hypothetical protein
MECSFYMHLESNGVELEDIEYESLRIPYKSGKRVRHYVPDFLAAGVLYEVKPTSRQKGRTFDAKCAAGRRYASDEGLEFVVVSEKDLKIISRKDAIAHPSVHLSPRRRKR